MPSGPGGGACDKGVRSRHHPRAPHRTAPTLSPSPAHAPSPTHPPTHSHADPPSMMPPREQTPPSASPNTTCRERVVGGWVGGGVSGRTAHTRAPGPPPPSWPPRASPPLGPQVSSQCNNHHARAWTNPAARTTGGKDARDASQAPLAISPPTTANSRALPSVLVCCSPIWSMPGWVGGWVEACGWRKGITTPPLCEQPVRQQYRLPAKTAPCPPPPPPPPTPAASAHAHPPRLPRRRA